MTAIPADAIVRVAVVTGAASGIGAATCRELASYGIAIVANARREHRLQELAEEIQDAGGKALAVPGDITLPDTAQTLIDRALETFGRLDIVVNNAGVMHEGPLAEMEFTKIQQTIDVNVTAAFRLTQLSVALFRKQGYGHLVQVSSILGTKIRPGAAAYSGTKHALEAITEAARLELSDTDVKVTAIEPGYVTTELHNHWPVKPRERMGIDGLPPEAVARCIAFAVNQPPDVLIPKLMVVPTRQPL